MHVLYTVSMFRVLFIRNFHFPTCHLQIFFSYVLLFVHLFLSAKLLFCKLRVSTFCIDVSVRFSFKQVLCSHVNAPAAPPQQRSLRETEWGCRMLNPLNAELNPICCLLALLGACHFLHVSRIRVKLLTFRLLMSYIYGAPILDVSRSHTTTQHSR